MISVIIPTLNEAPRLPALLAALRAEPVAVEAIVVDGGSADGTAAVAREAGADLVLDGPGGRGPQVAAGAAAARGGTVLILHADSRFPAGGLVALQRLLDTRPEVVGGNFRLVFDHPDAAWIETFYATIRALGLFYGDSGIFVRRSVLDAIGGIRPLALMEDYDLVRRMRAAGPIAQVPDPPLVTSARRFAGRSRLSILTGWARIHLLYWGGMTPERLARLYDSARERG